MYVTFQEKYLQDLYEQGTTDDKQINKDHYDYIKRC